MGRRGQEFHFVRRVGEAMPGTQRQSPDNRFLALYRYEDHVMKLFILQIGTNRVISGRGRHHYRHGTAESTFSA